MHPKHVLFYDLGPHAFVLPGSRGLQQQQDEVILKNSSSPPVFEKLYTDRCKLGYLSYAILSSFIYLFVLLISTHIVGNVYILINIALFLPINILNSMIKIRTPPPPPPPQQLAVTAASATAGLWSAA